MVFECSLCKKLVTDGDKINCDSCNLYYHTSCTGLSYQEIQCIRSINRKLNYFCSKCDVSTMLVNLHEIVMQLQDEVKLLRESSIFPTMETEDLKEELEDRKRRSNNLLLYNVPEPTANSASDRETVMDLMGRLPTPPTDLPNVQISRLGKTDAQKVRPLKVVLKNKSEVMLVLKNCRNLPNNIKAASDKTKMQRECLRELWNELQTLGNNGEDTESENVSQIAEGVQQLASTPLNQNQTAPAFSALQPSPSNAATKENSIKQKSASKEDTNMFTNEVSDNPLDAVTNANCIVIDTDSVTAPTRAINKGQNAPESTLTFKTYEIDPPSDDKLKLTKYEANVRTGSKKTSSAMIKIKSELPSKEGQWASNNLGGKTVYSKMFLLDLRDSPVSRKKPDNVTLPDAIVMDGRRLYRNRNDFTAIPFTRSGDKPTFRTDDEIDRLAPPSIDKLIQTEHEANVRTSSETNSSTMIEIKSELPYKEEDKKIYDRDFLIALRNHPASRKKPDNVTLPDAIVVDIERLYRDRIAIPFKIYSHKSRFHQDPSHKRYIHSAEVGSGGGKGNKSHVAKLLISVRGENSWKPTRFQKYDNMTEERKTEQLFKKVSGVLNKLTPRKFEILLSQVRELQIDTEERLQGVVNLIFEKAVNEPNYSVTYALMCKELALMQAPAANSTYKTFVQFSKFLVHRCQVEFEKQIEHHISRRDKVKEILGCQDPKLLFDLEEYDRHLRMKSLGTICLIGELFEQQMLTNNVMLLCLDTLLDNRDEKNLECLCKLLTIIGEGLEKTCNAKEEEHLNRIFCSMQDIVDKKYGEVKNRVRFMLQNVLDLRKNKWVYKHFFQIEPLHFFNCCDRAERCPCNCRRLEKV